MSHALDQYLLIWDILEGRSDKSWSTVFAPDIRCQFEVELEGIEAAAAYFDRVRDVFPELQHEVVSVVESADGRALAAEVIAQSRQGGPLSVGDVELPPAGGVASFSAADLLWFDEQGLVRKWNAYTDHLAVLMQLGQLGPLVRAMNL